MSSRLKPKCVINYCISFNDFEPITRYIKIHHIKRPHLIIELASIALQKFRNTEHPCVTSIIQALCQLYDMNEQFVKQCVNEVLHHNQTINQELIRNLCVNLEIHEAEVNAI